MDRAARVDATDGRRGGTLRQPNEHVSDVSREGQASMGLAAYNVYSNPAAKMYKPDHPGGFDVRLLSLFESIEQCKDDIDGKIVELHQHWRHEGLFARQRERIKMNYVWTRVYGPMQRGVSDQTPEVRQLKANWSRLLRITNAHWFSPYEIAPEWIGPRGRSHSHP
jgi:hypothetical protein